MSVTWKANPLISLCIIAVASVLFLSVFTGGAQAQIGSCFVSICKEAPQLPPPSESQSVEFPFSIVVESIPSELDITANGLCPAFQIFFGSVGLDAIEFPTDGWTLEDVECVGQGINVVEYINGVTVTCAQNAGEATCTFVNVRDVSQIPTMSEWGMIGVAGALGLIGVFYAVRRRKAEA